MSEQEESRESSFDPSIGSIENRVYVYSPEREGYQAGLLDDEDDDDMDFVPAEEGIDEEGEDMDESAFEDAEENLSGIDIEFEEVTDDSQAEGESQNDASQDQDSEQVQPQRTQMRLTREQLIELIGHNGLRQLFTSHYYRPNRGGQDDDEEEEDGSDTSTEGRSVGWGLRSRRRKNKEPAHKIEPAPYPVGQKLMESGTFGYDERDPDIIRRRRKKELVYGEEDGHIRRRKKMVAGLLRRELGLNTPSAERARFALNRQEMIPKSNADMIINYNDRCYSGQFSKDGNFFFSCAQDFKVRMYDTSNPYDWKYYKTVDVPLGSWTITDASLSPDNRLLAISSIRNIVTLANTDPTADRDSSDHQLLDFAQMVPGATTGTPRARRNWGGYGHFGIWSLRFSGDGRELVAGTGDNSVYVYDLERRQSILRIPGHDDDVNAVCYGDEKSPHILYSGSDDTTLKIWDRRSLGDGRAAGAFLGHTEGLTYVDSKGDGRYVLSNGKDQTTKLWDLRKTVPTEKANRMNHSRYTTNFDYRQESFDYYSWQPHPHDCSLVTFRGHSILRTLIRCHFSPPRSSDQRYVYSGSQDGKVWIWNLDGTVKGQIDVLAETKNTRPKDDSINGNDFYWSRNSGYWRTVVRDASWHPDVGMIAATSWNGYGQGWGTCSVHSWNDDYQNYLHDRLDAHNCANYRSTAKRVDARLRHDDAYYRHEKPNDGVSSRTRSRRNVVGGDDDDTE